MCQSALGFSVKGQHNCCAYTIRDVSRRKGTGLLYGQAFYMDGLAGINMSSCSGKWEETNCSTRPLQGVQNPRDWL